MKKNKKQIHKHTRKQRFLAEPFNRPRLALRFTPLAWAKLHYFCHHAAVEIGGFGITAKNDLLLVEDFITVKQDVTAVSVSFDDEAVADFFEQQVDQGRSPQQFARIWCHTHPGNSPTPSCTDEETFTEAFGNCEWAVMFILAEYGKTYARLRFNVGPGGSVQIPVEVDYHVPFSASNHGQWKEEYESTIHPQVLMQRQIPIGWEDEFDPTFKAALLAYEEDAVHEEVIDDELFR